MAELNARIKDGELVIRVPLEKKPEPSSSGKTLMAYTSRGFIRSDAKYQGKPLSISLNVCIPNK